MATKTTGTTELIDMGARRDTLGRVVMSKERRLELVQAWQSSGLTLAAFAKREGVRYSCIGCANSPPSCRPGRCRSPGSAGHWNPLTAH